MECRLKAGPGHSLPPQAWVAGDPGSPQVSPLPEASGSFRSPHGVVVRSRVGAAPAPHTPEAKPADDPWRGASPGPRSVPKHPAHSPAAQWCAALSPGGLRGCKSLTRGPPRLLASCFALPPGGAQGAGTPVPGPPSPGAPNHSRSPPAPEPPSPGLTDLVCGHSPGALPGTLEGHDASGRGSAGLSRSPLVGFVLVHTPRHRAQGGLCFGRGPAPGLVPPPDGHRHPRTPDFGLPESGGTEAPFESRLGRKAGSSVAVGLGG
ncbi:hypothetical protein NDU88_004792 [Pleurodeles waltl]|uniref:Basic proline-rich protein-like n=1 Tax=Pleurodeles waltl TaxID=8319 RepID=A0AAV7NPL0_PLEWA|nr:hypothetical protein NDU88_004792 [Pleurodeles waltl]